MYSAQEACRTQCAMLSHGHVPRRCCTSSKVKGVLAAAGCVCEVVDWGWAGQALGLLVWAVSCCNTVRVCVLQLQYGMPLSVMVWATNMHGHHAGITGCHEAQAVVAVDLWCVTKCCSA